MSPLEVVVCTFICVSHPVICCAADVERIVVMVIGALAVVGLVSSVPSVMF